MTKKYMGFKMVDAWESEKEGQAGYAVKYPDGYISWSPKDAFEKAYMQVSDNNTITNENVDSFILRYEDFIIGDKTTVVRAVLTNGFVVVESSSCVDPKNFNHEIGIKVCKEKVKTKVWELLGFLLQTAKEGI